MKINEKKRRKAKLSQRVNCDVYTVRHKKRKGPNKKKNRIYEARTLQDETFQQRSMCLFYGRHCSQDKTHPEILSRQEVKADELLLSVGNLVI